jgi:serine/threonine-protein kinase
MDNMEKRSVKGTQDWTEVSIVMDVPESAKSFMMGVILAGKGRMWVSGLSFAVVDKSVPVTTIYKEADFKAHLEENKKPRNLDFSE